MDTRGTLGRRAGRGTRDRRHRWGNKGRGDKQRIRIITAKSEITQAGTVHTQRNTYKQINKTRDVIVCYIVTAV